MGIADVFLKMATIMNIAMVKLAVMLIHTIFRKANLENQIKVDEISNDS